MDTGLGVLGGLGGKSCWILCQARTFIMSASSLSSSIPAHAHAHKHVRQLIQLAVESFHITMTAHTSVLGLPVFHAAGQLSDGGERAGQQLVHQFRTRLYVCGGETRKDAVTSGSIEPRERRSAPPFTPMTSRGYCSAIFCY